MRGVSNYLPILVAIDVWELEPQVPRRTCCYAGIVGVQWWARAMDHWTKEREHFAHYGNSKICDKFPSFFSIFVFIPLYVCIMIISLTFFILTIPYSIDVISMLINVGQTGIPDFLLIFQSNCLWCMSGNWNYKLHD